jgi:hypothetical protein
MSMLIGCLTGWWSVFGLPVNPEMHMNSVYTHTYDIKVKPSTIVYDLWVVLTSRCHFRVQQQK